MRSVFVCVSRQDNLVGERKNQRNREREIYTREHVLLHAYLRRAQVPPLEPREREREIKRMGGKERRVHVREKDEKTRDVRPLAS